MPATLPDVALMCLGMTRTRIFHSLATGLFEDGPGLRLSLINPASGTEKEPGEHLPNEQENIPHGRIRDLDREHSRIPFQHIPKAVPMLLLSGVCSIKNLHIRSELSAEESAVISTNISMSLKQLLL